MDVAGGKIHQPDIRKTAAREGWHVPPSEFH